MLARSSAQCTGWPSAMAAIGTSSSSGHGCTILTPNPPPTSGATTSTFSSDSLQLGRDGRAHRGGGLGGGVHAQRGVVVVPDGVHAFASMGMQALRSMYWVK